MNITKFLCLNSKCNNSVWNIKVTVFKMINNIMVANISSMGFQYMWFSVSVPRWLAQGCTFFCSASVFPLQLLFLPAVSRFYCLFLGGIRPDWQQTEHTETAITIVGMSDEEGPRKLVRLHINKGHSYMNTYTNTFDGGEDQDGWLPQRLPCSGLD